MRYFDCSVKRYKLCVGGGFGRRASAGGGLWVCGPLRGVVGTSGGGGRWMFRPLR